MIINDYQGVVGRILDTPLCFYWAYKLGLEESVGRQSQLIKLMPWLERFRSIDTRLDPVYTSFYKSKLFLLGPLLFVCSRTFSMYALVVKIAYRL
jgi:hypothetical protein